MCTKGENDDEEPKELVNFLKFVASIGPFEADPLVERLQSSISRIKSSREMEGRYMLFEELQEQNYQLGKLEGKLESVITVLSINGILSENARNTIEGVINEENVDDILKEAASSKSVDEFWERLSSK